MRPSEAPAPAPAPAGEGPEHGLRPPFVMELVGPGRTKAGELIEAEIVLRLQGLVRAPLHLQVRPGPGIHMVEGMPDETIPAGDEPQLRRKLLLRVDDPAGAVEVLAEMRGEGFGATARRAFFFDGRPPGDPNVPARRPMGGFEVEPLPARRPAPPATEIPPGLPVRNTSR